MTPKEKADELIEKYLNTIIHFPYIDTEDGNCIGTGYMTHQSAKICSLLTVDEIINTDMLIDESTYLETKSYLHYWQQVKTEINAL